MPLNPTDIPAVSQLLDQALALPVSERDAWLASLPAEHQRHTEALRDMLAQEALLDTDDRLQTVPKLATDDSVAHADDRIGPYRLIREIGRGGMGSVWLAERADGAYKRQVALKLPRLAWGAGLAERMTRERDIGALLEHPNIARLYDAGVDERGRPFLALEYIEGQPIDAWCEAQGLSVRDRLRLFLQVIKAVAYAHGRLVVHRDLKPSNVLVTPDGQVHLLDFGIAKLLLEGAPGNSELTLDQGRVLTPHYASPEQIAAEPITVQSDVYSLGVLLYELVTGTLPIEPKRGTIAAVEDAILAGQVPLASSRVSDRFAAKALRGEIDAILAKAMQRSPERRYPTADAIAQDIQRFLNGETVSARPDSLAYRLRKSLRRHWAGTTAVAIVLIAVLSGSGVAVVQANRAARAAERERVVKDFVADVFRANSRVQPRNAVVRPPTPQALIEGGAQLIQQRFAGQPELQAELFGLVGGLFSDMGAYRLAADYATRKLEALTTLRADPLEQAKGLLELGQALFDDRRVSDAEPRARRAIELSPRLSETHIGGLILLGRIQSATRQVAATSSTLDDLDGQLAKGAEAPASARAWVMYLRAVQMSVANRFDEAMPVFDAAIQTAEASEGPLSLSAITFRLGYARRLGSTTYAARAQQQFDAAASSLRRLGGTHEVRAAFETAKFAAGRYLDFAQITGEEALAALEQSQKFLEVSTLPVPPWFIPEINFLRARVNANFGNAVEAWRLMDVAVPELSKFNNTIVGRADLTVALGDVASSVGRHDHADNLLREALSLRRQQGRLNHPYIVGYYFAIAENLMMAGRYRDALTVLDDVPPIEPIRGEGLSEGRYIRMLSLLRARIKTAEGRAKEALEILLAAAPAGNDSFNDWTEYRAALGEALCELGRSGEGVQLLKQAVAADEPHDYLHTPWIARRRALIGLCALRIGDRRQALRYAAMARAAFTAQSGVSPYFKAPLLRLENSLGLRLPPV